jgi:diacylglycerol kinase family enzyme
MDRFKRIPLVQGSMAYTIAVFYSFFHKISYQLDIQIDDQPYISKDFLLLLLANGSHYGGGYNGAPTAMVDDGLLDFFGFFGLNRFQIIGLLNKYKLGLHMTEEKLKSKMIFRQGCNVKIRAREDVPVCIDGDIFLAKELEISLVPGCLRFAVPR